MSEESDDGLPAGWESACLAALYQINPPLDRCVVNDSIEVNFVPMRAVESEGAGLVRPEVRPYGEVKKGYTAFLSGDVIMAKITPCMENGKTTVVPDLPGSVCFGSTEFHVIRPETGVSARWIASFLVQHEVRRSAQRAMTGGVGQMRVPAAFLESLRVPIAPTKEQERIADALDELLSDLDAGVAALERVRDKLKLYRAAVLKAAVEGVLTAEWRKEHPQTEPASELLKRILAERRRHWEKEQLRKFKEKGREPPKNWKAKYREAVPPDTPDLSPLPEGWCWVTLDQLSVLVTSGSRGWAEYYADEGAIFIRAQDIRTDSLNVRSVARVKPPTRSEGVRTLVQSGDILVTITGANVTKAAFVDTQLAEAYVSQHVGLVRLVDARLSRLVHTYFVTPSGGRKRLLELAYGAGKPGLNLDNLRELAIPLPPEGEQGSFVDAVEDQLSIIDHLESDLDAKLTNAQALRQSILRRAFLGKLVPQDPKDQPASKLLKRIAAEREQRAREAAEAKRLNGHATRHAGKLHDTTQRAKATTKKEIGHGRIADR